MRCWIKCHLRAVQFLTWRPFDFDINSEAGSSNNSGTRWLASASNDGTTRLYNLNALFDILSTEAAQKQEQAESGTPENKEPLMIISSEATLQGHGVRVISCAWSPHNKNLLVTVAYDCTAIVSSLF
jgi:WD40 repeat protein